MEFTNVYLIEKISDPGFFSQSIMSDSSNTLQIQTMNYHERKLMRRQTKERTHPIMVEYLKGFPVA